MKASDMPPRMRIWWLSGNPEATAEELRRTEKKRRDWLRRFNPLIDGCGGCDRPLEPAGSRLEDQPT